MANSFWQREKGMKKMNSASFQGLENQKTLESFWQKEEEEVQRDSEIKVEKLFVKIVSKSLKMQVKVLLL